jgi:hypothetical protein
LLPRRIKMSVNIRIGALGLMILGSLGLFGCAPEEPVQTIDRVDITFDGQKCGYDGPVIIGEGTVVVALSNLSDRPTQLNVVKLDEGKTWQDMLDHQGEPGSYNSLPRWASRLSGSASVDEPDEREYTFEPGMHAVICLETLETRLGVWPGTALDVRAVPSQ